MKVSGCNIRIILFLAFILQVMVPAVGLAGAKQKPLMKDFIGLNGHFKFNPELYKQVCTLVRNYHNMNWDVAKPGDKITFPVCVNKVDWERDVYGKWVKHGFEVDICAQFASFGRENVEYMKLWQGNEEWAYQYGYEMAKFFGPSGAKKLCTSIEIDNEPGGKFDDKLYQAIFRKMAQGIRKGDPKIKIVTCTASSRESDDYSKNLNETFTAPDISKLYDVINLHVYAIKPKKKGQSPWDRSYPEDPALDYLRIVDEAIEWRDKKAKGKEIWITEFGWDACTDDVMKNRTGWFEKLDWTDVSDLDQARYLVRSILCFAERDIDRAYIYYYDDDNKPSVHASSGLTRNFQPKISFWAMKQLYETLGEMRFSKVIRGEEDDLYLYEFVGGHDKNAVIWVAWSPTGDGREKEMVIPYLPGRVLSVDAMAVHEHTNGKMEWKAAGGKAIKLKISGSPVYIKMSRNGFTR